MKPYYQDDHATLYHGDCIETMRTMPAGSVDAVITSPPYAMQRKATYGGIPEDEYPAWTVAWMAEARRVLKPNGSAIINISPHKVGGGLSDYVLRTRLALRHDGWTELDEIIWHKKDAMPTGAPHRPRRAWESLLWYGKHGQAWSDAKAGGHEQSVVNGFQRMDKAKREGWTHGGSGGVTPLAGKVRVPNIASLPKPKRSEFHHPAAFHWQLAEWCGNLICPPGGTILDPFSGSASTGVACIRNGWDYIGIDAVEEYVDMSRRRLQAEQDKYRINRVTS